MTTDVKASAIQHTEAQYPPSWIDLLIAWIDQLPVPAWLFYVLATLALTLLITVVLWIDGSVPFPSIGSIQGIFPPFVFYFLALYHYLTQVGSRSLQTFRPLLQVDDAEFAQIDYELATLPRWVVWIAIVVGVAALPPYFAADGPAFGDLVPQTVMPHIVLVASAAFFSITILCLIARSLRQLRMVYRLHAQATNINLLNLEPAHAFSNLTARTGIGLLLILVFGYLHDPSEFTAQWAIFDYLGLAFSAIVIFVVPVIGLQERLHGEKKRVLRETNDLLQMTTDSLEDKVRRGDFKDLEGMKTAIDVLIQKRELLEKVPTWPWNPATIRGFGSTLLLPIFLWLITRLLERFV